jgi:hypothetical protein
MLGRNEFALRKLPPAITPFHGGSLALAGKNRLFIQF